MVLASRDTQDENGRFPLDDPSTILCRDCRAIAQQRRASKGLSRELYRTPSSKSPWAGRRTVTKEASWCLPQETLRTRTTADFPLTTPRRSSAATAERSPSRGGRARDSQGRFNTCCCVAEETSTILRPLDHSSSPSPGQVPAQEGEQGTLEGALPDSILKVTMGGEKD